MTTADDQHPPDPDASADSVGEVQERMRRAVELFELSEEIMLQNLRRRNPEADEATIQKMFQRWLLERPGAKHGDASGPHFRVRQVEVHKVDL